MSLLKWKELAKRKTELGDKIKFCAWCNFEKSVGRKNKPGIFLKGVQTNNN